MENMAQDPSPGVEQDSTDEKPRREGRRRLFLGFGVLSLIAALWAAAAFNDFALLDFGAGGAGGKDNAYNIQVSAGQESTTAAVANWVEANPDAESIEISGADALSPGGQGVTVNLPVRNDSEKLASTLSLKIENTTQNPSSKDKAYAGLMRFDYAEVSDASSTPTRWKPLGQGEFNSAGTTTISQLGDLDARAGRVVVVRMRLADGADQNATNAANGGHVALQARFDGSSK